MEREALKKGSDGLDSTHASQREAQSTEYAAAPRTPVGGQSSSAGKSATNQAKAKQAEATKAYLTSMREAITKADTGALEQLMVNATKSDTKAHAKDAGLLRDFLAAYTTCSPDLNRYLDKLYVDVDDKDLLVECFDKRFGIPIRDGNAPWTLRAVARLYKNYIGMPVNQISMVKEIITDDSSAYGSSGWADYKGTIELSYPGDDFTQKGAWCDAGDLKHNLIDFDTTQLHETGHQVDKWNNIAVDAGVYSGSSGFKKLSGWQFEGDNSKKVAKKIHDYAEKPYAEELSRTEKKIAMIGAEKLVEDEVSGMTEMEDALEESYNELGKNIDGDTASQGLLDSTNGWIFNSPTGYRSLSDLTSILANSKLYSHIMTSVPSQDAWNQGNAAAMKRQIHKGYSGGKWYSFSNDARNEKMSRYQFRAPGEEFAELYATYHVSKGKSVGAKFKTWFESVGLHDGSNKYKK